jgi:hypothetical protein
VDYVATRRTTAAMAVEDVEAIFSRSPPEAGRPRRLAASRRWALVAAGVAGVAAVVAAAVLALGLAR